MRITFAAYLRTGNVLFSDPFVSRSSGMRETVVQQLRAYRFETVKRGGGAGFAPDKVVLTGKRAGKSDDVCLAVQIALFWSGTHVADGEKCLVEVGA